MSGLFGGASKATTHATRAMGIDFQGAQYGPVVPVVYGQNKVPGNCIWYGDFQSQSHQQKAGKGGGGSTTNYTYSASAQMGLCEGPIGGLVNVFDGTSIVNLGSINYAFATGTKGQAPWSHLSGSYALGYSLTATFSFQNLALGSSASLPNYNYEIKGLKPFSSSIVDANPADILTDITSDPYHGINFPYLGTLTQYSNYCVANGLFLSPVYDQQQSAQQTLSDLFKYTNAAPYYSDDQLKVVPLGDVAVTGNGVTYTPNVTPVVDLNDDDFLVNGSGDAPVQVSRTAPQDALNLVRVEFKDRTNTYHDSAVVASIDFDVVANGERSDNSETPNGITTGAVARFVAQNLVQRAFYVRNTYQFKLPWNYCYLEPTDIVTLTDASLGLTKYPVRITSIEEDGGSVLTIEAEEFPEGIGHSSIYGTQSNGGTNPDQNVDPGAVNAPFLFRGPGFLVSNNQPEIWCAVNGSNPLWAACDVYLSHDGTSYTYTGTIASQARYGSLTTALPAGTADPDVTNTPTAQLYAPAALLGGSQADADNFVTLAMVDTEVIGYETATLTAANTYKLSYLRRGGYGSANVAHAIGAPFVRLDDSIFRIPVDPSLIGQTVYLKFLSLNAFGRSPRTLAEETAYTYVVGTNVELPDVPDVPVGFAVTPVADGVELTWTNDNPAATGSTSIEYATASGGPFTVLAQVGPTTTAYHHGFTSGATYYYRARARGPLPQSGWSAYTAEISSTGKVVNGAGMDITTVGNPNFVLGLAGWSPDAAGWTANSTSATSPNPQITTFAEYYRSGFSGNGGLYNNTVNPCQAGDRFTATGQILANGGTGNAYVGIAWFNSSKSLIISSFGNAITGSTTGTSRIVGTAPAGAVYCEAVCAVLNYTGSGAYTFTGITLAPQPNTLGETPDGGGRYAAVTPGADNTAGAVQPSSWLTDSTNLARGGDSITRFGGRTFDNVGDGASRFAVASIDGNRRALVDFSQGAHLNKTQDYIGDGTTFVRTSAAAGAGPNVVANPAFTTPALASENAGTPFSRWSVSANPGNAFTFVTNSNAADPLSVRVGAITVPANSTVQAVVSNLALPGCTLTCKPGDSFWLGGTVELYWPGGFNPGLSVAAYVAVAWSDRTGAFLSNSARSPVTTSASGAVNVAPVTVAAPANAATGTVQLKYDLTAGSVAVTTDANPHYANFGNVYCRSISELAVPGSGQTVGDQRNLMPVTWAGVRSVLSASPITFSITSGSPNSTVNFSVAAVSLYAGSVTVSYNASSGSHSQVNGTTATYYLFYRDATGAGGSQTLYITVFPQTLAQYNDAVLIGSCDVTVASGGGGSGGTGGGGGGYCVADSMFVRDGRLAGDAEIGDPFDCIDLPTAAGKHVRALQGVTRGMEECVRMITSDGCALVCSVSTPFDLPNGHNTTALHMLGEQVITDLGTAIVTSLALVGPQPVTRANLGGVSYAAGADPHRRIYSHNAVSKP